MNIKLYLCTNFYDGCLEGLCYANDQLSYFCLKEDSDLIHREYNVYELNKEEQDYEMKRAQSYLQYIGDYYLLNGSSTYTIHPEKNWKNHYEEYPIEIERSNYIQNKVIATFTDDLFYQ